MALASSSLTASGTVGTSLSVSTQVTNAPSGSAVLLESGALPAGVTCSFNQQTGTLSVTGTPTAAGTYKANYYVGTVDCWRLATINITVANAVASCTITSNKAQIADATLVVGTPMVPQTVVISNIPSDATITAIGDALPAGITVTPSQVGSTLTAVFAGTPTVAGNFNSSVRVGNPAGCAVVIPIGFAIANATVVPTPTPTPTPGGGGGGGGTPTPSGCNPVATPIGSLVGTVGTPVPANTYTHSITGLGTNLTTTVMSGSLAPGVTVGAQIASGTKVVVGGTPTAAGNYSAVVRVSDGTCYVDVTVAANVTAAAVPDCGILFNDPAKNHLDFLLYVSGTTAGIEISTLESRAPVDIARVTDKYGVSISWLSGDPILQGMSLIWVPKTATWGAVEPANRTELTLAVRTVPLADLVALNGHVFSAVFRATSSTCTLDFPVNVTLNSSSLTSSGQPGTVEGGA